MRSRTPYIFSAITAVLAAISSLTPFFFDLYRRDPAFARGAQLGTDRVTLFVAVPLLLAAMASAARGSIRGRLIWIGMLEYMLYDFLYYLLGAQMNELFPVYILACVLPMYALIILMNRAYMTALGTALLGAPGKRIAAWMYVFAGLLGAMWVAQWYLLSFTAWPGSGLPREAVHLIAAIDLCVFFPAFVVIGTLAWRHIPLGLAHAASAMVMSAIYPLVLIASAPFQDKLGVTGSWTPVPLWIFFSLGSVIGAVAMLRRVRQPVHLAPG